MTPSAQESLTSAQSVKVIQRKGCFGLTVVLALGVGVSCLNLQWGIIITIFGLIAGQVLINRRRDPHEDVLRQFVQRQL